MPRKNLTPSAIEALPLQLQRYDVTDARERGLSVRVHPSGLKVFRYRMREGNGPSRVVTIGPYSPISKHGYVTLSQARERLEQLREAKRGGADRLDEVAHDVMARITPKPAAVDAKGKTIAEVAREFWKVLDKQRKRGRTEAEPIYRKHVEPVIGALPLTDVKRSHCGEVVQRAYDGGATVHAGKVLAILKQLLDFGARRFADDDWLNPAARLRAKDFGVHQRKRQRWLDENELPIFWRALDAKARRDEVGGHDTERRRMAAALRLLLVLGLRSSELRLARWEHVDFQAGTLTIPVDHQKLTPTQAEQARPFVVPLPSLAVDLLRELETLADGAPRLLATEEKVLGRYMRGLFRGEPKRRVKPHPALRKLAPAQPHDLRRTCRSWLGRLGVAPHVAERCLNHSLGRIVDTYDVGDYLDERRAALGKWASHVASLTASAAR
jgi:integrase